MPYDGHMEATMPTQILRLTDVRQRTGLGRSTIYARIADGRFPPAIKIGERAVGWLSEDIEAWIRARVAESRQAASS